MGEVHMLHGSYLHLSRGLQTERNYVPLESLRRYLIARSEPYVPLEDRHKADALTFDDSTIGAYDACCLARDLGHHVTLFVNPAQIINNWTYWFSLLDVILDNSTNSFARHIEGSAGEATYSELRELRLSLKNEMMCLSAKKANDIVLSLSKVYAANIDLPPKHVQTLTFIHLNELVALGVDIQAHGWDHQDIRSMTTEQLIDDFVKSEAWFQVYLKRSPSFYAVPYGNSPVKELERTGFPGQVFLASSNQPLGDCLIKHWNRLDITRRVKLA